VIYQYECSCGNTKDEIRRVAERNDPVVCSCGKNMERVIGGHYVTPDMAPYYDDNLETYVTSRQHRKEVMRERGVSEIYGKHWYTGRSAKGR
jgi:putative FmdB family regulatory protein